MIDMVIIHRAGQKQNACFADQFIAKRFYITAEITRESHRASARTDPGKEMRLALKEIIYNREIVLENDKIPINQLLTITHCNFCQILARRGIANRSVVFDGCHTLIYFS